MLQRTRTIFLPFCLKIGPHPALPASSGPSGPLSWPTGGGGIAPADDRFTVPLLTSAELLTAVGTVGVFAWPRASNRAGSFGRAAVDDGVHQREDCALQHSR